MVTRDKLRLTSRHLEGISAAICRKIERQVNSRFLQNTSVRTEVTRHEQGLAKGRLALFDEKYGRLRQGSEAWRLRMATR